MKTPVTYILIQDGEVKVTIFQPPKEQREVTKFYASEMVAWLSSFIPVSNPDLASLFNTLQEVDNFKPGLYAAPTGMVMEVKEVFEPLSKEDYNHPSNLNRDTPIVGFRKQVAIVSIQTI